MKKHHNQKQLKGAVGEAYFSFQFQRERMTQTRGRNRKLVDHIFIDTQANRQNRKRR